MLPGDRLICGFVERLELGFQFKTWPLHITVVPWFRLDAPSDAMAQGLEQALHTIRPFEATGADQTMFGPRRQRPATLLQQPTPFSDIEQKVRTYLHKKRAWLVDETTKLRREYRPHVTAQRERRLEQGTVFQCERLYIVEQKGDHKEVVGVVNLGPA
jgi:2'-5' RNA ligase